MERRISSLPAAAPAPSQEARRKALRTIAGMSTRSFQVVAAKIHLGVDTALAWRHLDTLVRQPTGDMFWMYPAAGFYFSCREKLDAPWRMRFRRAMKEYTPYRGDTENHFLMYYTTLLLFSQEWPDMQASEWFNGKSSRENYAEAKSYLEHWIDETAREALTEWDSPRYLYFYLTPLLILHEYTADSLLAKRAGMMIEYQLADFATEYLNGSYCGAHSRDGDNSVIDPRNSEARSYGEFYFEDSLSFILPDLAYAALCRFQCPEIIRDIAHSREVPFEHRELKRSRAKIRRSAQRYTPVYKYTYMTRDYALGSMQGGIEQPIQQHSWDVTFASGRKNNTLFGLHPQASGWELGTFFPEEPEIMVEVVAASKGSYVSEEKWIGGSPVERIFQHRNALVALYDLDTRSRYRHVDLFFPKTADTVERHYSGWIFCRMESGYAAVFPLNNSFTWAEESINWRLRMNARRDEPAGYLVECGSEQDLSYEEFRKRRAASIPAVIPVAGRLGSAPTLIRFRTTGGEEIEATFTPRAEPAYRLNGAEVTRTNSMLFDGPYLRSATGSGVLRMECNGRVRTLDFVRNVIEEG